MWTEECSKSFQAVKEKLVEAQVLIHPDFTKSFILDVDASDLSIGAVLSQITVNGELLWKAKSEYQSRYEPRHEKTCYDICEQQRCRSAYAYA